MINLKQYTNIAAVFATLTFGGQLHAQNYGIKFLGTQTADLVTGTAGVVPLSGWNNITNGTFTTGTINSSGSGTATLTLSGAAANTWRSGSTPDGGNGSLMDGYIDGSHGGTGTIAISGLTSGGLYNLYLYTFADQTRPSNGGDDLPNYSVNGTTYYVPVLGVGTSSYTTDSSTVGGAFSGFVQGTTSSLNSTNVQPASTFGNYIELANVVAAGGVITIQDNPDQTTWRSPLNGIELISVVPEPSVMALSVAGIALFGLIRRRRA
jgi:hypothetical protein